MLAAAAFLATAAILSSGLGLVDMARWAAEQQRAFHTMVQKLLTLERGGTMAAAGLISACLAYGFLHAAVPGHGKFLIAGAGLASRISTLRLVALSVAASLAQAVTAVVLVYGSFTLLDITAGWAMTATDRVLIPLSYAAILAIGVVLIRRGIRGVAAVRGHRSAGSSDHPGACHAGCSHRHAPTRDEVDAIRTWRDAAVLIAGIGLRPCTGAVFVLVAAWRMDLLGIGALSAVAMALGTGAFVSLVAVSATTARGATLAATGLGNGGIVLPLLQVLAGGAIASMRLPFSSWACPGPDTGGEVLGEGVGRPSPTIRKAAGQRGGSDPAMCYSSRGTIGGRSMDISMLHRIERKVLWLSCWMIHNANHLREPDEVKVGGHQASSASMVQIMTALYFRILRKADRVAVKPHASPVFHAIQYLAGRQTVARMKAFRGWGGVQAYPSRTKDGPMVDFSTGSVGLGVAMTAFASLVQDYINAKGWSGAPREGRMIALVGDAELDEGNVYECLQEGWKHGLRNTWWIIDYNRQSLDGVVREGLYQRIEHVFRAFGWDIVTLKYGALQRGAFDEPGGEALRRWIDQCPNSLYSALTFQGGAAWRKALMDDIGDQGAVTALLDRRSDADLAALMENLGGHCLETLIDAFEAVDHDRPVVFIAYTVKGWGTPLAGHKDNHAGLMTPAQMAVFRGVMDVADGEEWSPEAGLDVTARAMREAIDATPYFAPSPAAKAPATVTVPELATPSDRTISTQAAFGKILDGIARKDDELSRRILTTSPDVTVSTNLGPWVNRRGLFAHEAIADLFREHRVPSAQKWQFSPHGQHLELGIAEMNLFLLLGAAGLADSLFGEQLFPVGTLYDPFIARGLDALNYACYQDARFMVAATPSGVTLAPEGGAHQSINAPLIAMSQDGLAAFEPAFADELGVMMRFGFEHMQRRGGGPDPRTLLPDGAGGATALRLSTRPLEQPFREMTPELARAVCDGAYWLRAPGPSAEVIVAAQGVAVHEAIRSAALIAEGRRDVGVLAVTSADRLHQGWTNARKARMDGRAATSVIEQLLGPLPRHAGIVTVIDGHPATLSWLGSVEGHRVAALGVDHFGQTGRVGELYAHYGINAEGIARAADDLVPRRRLRLASG